MKRFLTNAPDAYDYGYTTEVGRTEHFAYEGARPLAVRIVEIPESHATYQCDRYGSGLYVAIPYEPTPEQRIAHLEAAVRELAATCAEGFIALKELCASQDAELHERLARWRSATAGTSASGSATRSATPAANSAT